MQQLKFMKIDENIIKNIKTVIIGGKYNNKTKKYEIYGGQYKMLLDFINILIQNIQNIESFVLETESDAEELFNNMMISIDKY